MTKKKRTWIKGYTRSDGRVVKGYYRDVKPSKKKKKRATRKRVDPLEGFKRLEPTRVLPPDIDAIQRVAADQQRHSLRGAARQLDTIGKFSTSVTVHANRDGTVDGELRIFDIKKGFTVNRLLTEVAKVLHGDIENPSEFRLPEGHWYSVGALTDWGGDKEDWEATYQAALKRGSTVAEARNIASAASSALPRYRGQDRVALYPQRSEDLPAQIFRAQQGMLGEALRDATGKALGRGRKTKPNELLIRAFWNPWDRSPAPSARGKRGKKKKKR